MNIYNMLSTAWRLLAGIIITSFPVAYNQEVSDVITETLDGPLRGTRRNIDVGIRATTTMIDEYLGIPYAEPPVGSRRFKPPEPVKGWHGVRDARSLGPVCPQTQSTPDDITSEDKQSEDCLYLNVYSPYEADKPTKHYPVMLFIHGGSYEYGSGNRYNGSALAQYGIVFIAINYRLGSLGFLSAGSGSDLPGNFGLQDQLMALRWIRKNIERFRGDPENVTIFGSSAGGASVGLLMMSPKAKGLFHKVIAQSGTANAMWATFDLEPETLHNRFMDLASKLHCTYNTVAENVDCLRNKPTQQLSLKSICEYISCLGVDPPMKPVIDNDIIVGFPKDLLLSGDFPTLPYMTGTVRAEFGDYYGDSFTKSQMESEVSAFIETTYGYPAAKMIKYHYTDWNKSIDSANSDAEYMKKNYLFAEVLTDLGLVAPTSFMAENLSRREKSQVYTYYLDHHTSYHSVELNYIFGVPYIGGSVDEIEILRNFTDIDKTKSSLFMKMWSNFAKYGKPKTEEDDLDINWTQTRPGTIDYLHMVSTMNDLQTHMSVRFKCNEVALWNALVPDLAATCRHCKASKSCDVSKTWMFFGLTICLLCVVIILLCAIVWSHKNDLRGSTKQRHRNRNFKMKMKC